MKNKIIPTIITSLLFMSLTTSCMGSDKSSQDRNDKDIKIEKKFYNKKHKKMMRYHDEGRSYNHMFSKNSWRGFLFKELNLNKKQRQKLISIKREDINKKFQLKQKGRNLRHKLHMQLMKSAKKFDDKKINKIISEIGKLEVEKLKRNVQKIKKLKKILNKEQQDLLLFELLWKMPSNFKRDFK